MRTKDSVVLFFRIYVYIYLCSYIKKSAPVCKSFCYFSHYFGKGVTVDRWFLAKLISYQLWSWKLCWLGQSSCAHIKVVLGEGFVAAIDVVLLGASSSQSRRRDNFYQFLQTSVLTLRRHASEHLIEDFKASRISPSAVHVLLINCN